MQISVISLMILPSPWLCSSSVVNMSSGTREFGKCVKTQLQLVCSNYGSGEFITTSLLIKRDFLLWINVIYKGKFQSSQRRLLPLRAGLTDPRSAAAPGPGRGRGLGRRPRPEGSPAGSAWGGSSLRLDNRPPARKATADRVLISTRG